MIFVLFCFNVWYQESRDIWDIRVLIRTGKIIIFVELLDGWLSSIFGLALIFEIKNSLVKKFVVLHRNLQILFYLSVSRCLHTMYCDWKRQSSKQAVAMLSSISGYFPDHIKHQYFWRGEISFLYSLYDEDNFKLAIFFFWKWERHLL